jgi:hypothetical protein
MIVRTQSGSTYLFDNEALTWERVNTNVGHEEIAFYDGEQRGKLAAPVEPRIGERLTFFLSDHDYIVTTPVVEVA